MPPTGGLFFHLTCLEYIPYLGNYRDLKITKLAVIEHLFENK